MRHHGTDPARATAMRERVEAMKMIWTSEVAEYHGEHVDFDPLWQWPKPLQHPHPPVFIGGNGPKVLDRVLRYGDGWMPNVSDPRCSPPRMRSCGSGRPPRTRDLLRRQSPRTSTSCSEMGVDRGADRARVGLRAEVLPRYPRSA